MPGGFFFYLPPETKRTPHRGIDSAVARYRGAGLEITSDFGQSGIDVSGTSGADGVDLKIGGYGARVWKSPGAITVFFEHGKSCLSPRCPYFAEGDKLSLRASCDSDEACKLAWIALESVRFW